MSRTSYPSTQRKALRADPAVPRSGQGSPPRLTVRGRALVVALLVVLALAAFSLGRASVDAATVARPTTSYVTVQPGESLWVLARRVAPRADPRETVERIRRLNSLPDAQVQAGQRLAVPVS